MRRTGYLRSHGSLGICIWGPGRLALQALLQVERRLSYSTWSAAEVESGAKAHWEVAAAKQAAENEQMDEKYRDYLRANRDSLGSAAALAASLSAVAPSCETHEVSVPSVAEVCQLTRDASNDTKPKHTSVRQLVARSETLRYLERHHL